MFKTQLLLLLKCAEQSFILQYAKLLFYEHHATLPSPSHLYWCVFEYIHKNFESYAL